MKNAGILLIILLLLSLGAYILFQNNQDKKKGTKSPDRNFTIESMDIVEKIIIKHVKLGPMEFSRTGKSSWLLNGKYKVNDAVFINIEKCLTDMKMLYIPSKAANKTIEESIRSNGIAVSLFEKADDKNPFKTFFIGTDTQKGEGTHMLMDGSSQPYVMHLPGLMGGLRSRFEQPMGNYRDKYLYKLTLDNIEYIKVQYPKSEASSFIIEIKSPLPTVSLLSKLNDQQNKKLNERILRQYIGQFEQLGAEELINDFPSLDSIITKIPYCIVEVKTRDGLVSKNSFFGYEDIMEGKLNARMPKDIKFLNRLFVWTEGRDFYTVQSRVFGGIFMDYKDFYR